MASTIDTTDTKRALAKHESGDLYIVEYASVWDGENCTGTKIIAAAGPVSYRALGNDGGPLEPSAELYDTIDRFDGLTSEDADWLQEEEDAGRLTSPIGAR